MRPYHDRLPSDICEWAAGDVNRQQAQARRRVVYTRERNRQQRHGLSV
jgi:hypothetical protein